MTDRETMPELPTVGRLTLLEWLRGRLGDLRRSENARNALCEHDERVGAVRYW